MVRAVVILVLLVAGIVALVSAAVSLALKLIGAVVWIGLAFLAWLAWSRSRSRPG